MKRSAGVVVPSEAILEPIQERPTLSQTSAADDKERMETGQSHGFLITSNENSPLFAIALQIIDTQDTTKESVAS